MVYGGIKWSRDQSRDSRHVTLKDQPCVLVTSIRLKSNISKMAGDRDSVPKDYQ